MTVLFTKKSFYFPRFNESLPLYFTKGFKFYFGHLSPRFMGSFFFFKQGMVRMQFYFLSYVDKFFGSSFE